MTFLTRAAELSAFTLLVCGLGGALAAQEAKPDYRAELRKVCSEDYKKHCNGVLPGGGRIRDCMLTNIEKLSPDCRAGVEEWKKSQQKS